jgi:hypothetical protein
LLFLWLWWDNKQIPCNLQQPTPCAHLK